MNPLVKSIWTKILLAAASALAIGLIAGCASDFAAPYDMASLYYEYSQATDSDGAYMIITKHTVSQTDVKIPDKIYGTPVKVIGESAFADEEALQSVTFGKYVTKIDANAFGGCTALASVSFNVSMSDVGDYAFTGCTALKEVFLPDQVTSVGSGAFYGCTSLESITLPETLRHVGGRSFADTPWLNAQTASDFVTVGDGILINYTGDGADVTVSKTIRQISGAFAGNTKLQSVTFPANLESIGDMAFLGCSSLKAVTIPDSVTEIGDRAFCGCTSLERLVLGDNIQTVGKDAFDHCAASLSVTEGSAVHQYCIENDIACTVR